MRLDVKARFLKRELSKMFPHSDVRLSFCHIDRASEMSEGYSIVNNDFAKISGDFSVRDIIEFCTDVLYVTDYRKMIDDFPDILIHFDGDCCINSSEIFNKVSRHIPTNDDLVLIKTLTSCFIDKIDLLRRDIVCEFYDIIKFNDLIASDVCQHYSLEFYSDGSLYSE